MTEKPMPSDPYHDPGFAHSYARTTRELDLSAVRVRFLAHLPPRLPDSVRILDLGSGSGRDALAFRNAGYPVDAIDPSPIMAQLGEAHSGVPVFVRRAQELEASEAWDGIWACASLLHVAWAELPDVFRRLECALKPEGILYTSFKAGGSERTVGGRHFTDLNEERLRDRLREAPGLELLEAWESPDLRPERAHERWFNALLRRDA